MVAIVRAVGKAVSSLRTQQSAEALSRRPPGVQAKKYQRRLTEKRGAIYTLNLLCQMVAEANDTGCQRATRRASDLPTARSRESDRMADYFRRGEIVNCAGLEAALSSCRQKERSATMTRLWTLELAPYGCEQWNSSSIKNDRLSGTKLVTNCSQLFFVHSAECLA
jgi:hypothetical protein